LIVRFNVARSFPIVALAGACFAALPCGAVSPIAGAAPAPPSGRWREASLDDYRQHLSGLILLVQACAAARDLKNCDPLLVGPDDRVPFGDGTSRRLVRYGWLRVLFSRAEEPDEAASAPKSEKGSAKPVQPAPPTTTRLLQIAEMRLALDLAQANKPSAIAASHLEERGTMRQVLAGRDFRDLQQPTARDSVLEKVGGWLNHLLQKATELRARSAWIGRVVVWAFIVAVCVALGMFLLQLERRWRVRLVPENRVPAPQAPSARDWQLWLEDARRAAAAGAWRDAIHFVYWSAISRLESRRLWPADRARTPREYLALLASSDPRRAGLADLTGNFERVWYGGRPAGESEYRRAEELAVSLIEGGAA
jgi:Domain of unknown function (DUF4129)